MNLKCANGEGKDDSLIYVCHHCAVPICAEHGWVIPADDAFAESETPVARAAMHCGDCAEDFHRGIPRHHQWTAQVPGYAPPVRAYGSS